MQLVPICKCCMCVYVYAGVQLRTCVRSNDFNFGNLSTKCTCNSVICGNVVHMRSWNVGKFSVPNHANLHWTMEFPVFHLLYRVVNHLSGKKCCRNERRIVPRDSNSAAPKVRLKNYQTFVTNIINYSWSKTQCSYAISDFCVYAIYMFGNTKVCNEECFVYLIKLKHSDFPKFRSVF